MCLPLLNSTWASTLWAYRTYMGEGRFTERLLWAYRTWERCSRFTECLLVHVLMAGLALPHWCAVVLCSPVCAVLCSQFPSTEELFRGTEPWNDDSCLWVWRCVVCVCGVWCGVCVCVWCVVCGVCVCCMCACVCVHVWNEYVIQVRM